MPARVEPKTQQQTTIYGIGGLDVTNESELIGPDRMAELINFDLYAEDGIAQVRAAKQGGVTYQLPIRMITEHDGVLYTHAGTEVYNDANTSTSLSLSIGLGASTAESYTELDGRSTMYIAGAADMIKVLNGVSSSWGITAPVPGPKLTRTTGTLNPGIYGVVYTLVEKVGDTVIQESNPSPPDYLHLHTTLGISVSMGSTTQDDVTHYRVYRTQVNGSTFLFDKELPYVGGNITYVSVTDDDDLGTAVSEDNDPPILTNIFAIFQDRGFLSDGINVYFSEKSNLNAWPQLNFLPVGTPSDPVVALVASPAGLGVFRKRKRFKILESLEDVTAIGAQLPFFGGASNTFFAIPSSDSRGALGLRAAVAVSEGILYVSHDGVFVTNLADQDVFIGADIRGLFHNNGSENILPLDIDSSFVVALEFQNRYYVSYTDTDNTSNTLVYSKTNQKWYHYDFGFLAAYASNTINAMYAGIDTQLTVIENVKAPNTESITASMRTHELHFGLPFIRKVLHYIYVDSDLITGETLSGTLYVDGVLNQTFTVSNNQKVRFAAGVFGRTFAVDLSYTGTRRLKVRGMRLIWTPMAMG